MDQPTTDTLDALVFHLDGHSYGLPVSCVTEVIRAVTVGPLPGAPDIVTGIINVRGSAVPVVDIRRRFVLAPKPVQHTDHFILAMVAERQVGIHVDRAYDLVSIDGPSIEEAEEVVPGARLTGKIAKLSSGLVFIHDLKTLLSQDEFAAVDEAIAAAAGGSEMH